MSCFLSAPFKVDTCTLFPKSPTSNSTHLFLPNSSNTEPIHLQTSRKSMSTISSFTFVNSNSNILLPSLSATFSTSSGFQVLHPSYLSLKFPPCLHILSTPLRKGLTPVCCKSRREAEELSSPEDEWLQKLPDKKKPLYSHSLPCIEAWLRNLGFGQSNDDRAVWLIQKPDWHAQLSLDVTDLYIRYLKSGPGNLEKDVERRFSYALSREDIENAVLGGP